VIYLAADHRGYRLKEKIKGWLERWGIEYRDCGNTEYNPDDDYVDFAIKAVREVSEGHGKAILVCGSGHGVSIVANKFPGVRSVLSWDLAVARQGRTDENANVLSLPADHLDDDQAREIVQAWLETEFEGGRHARRIGKVAELEQTLYRDRTYRTDGTN